MDTVPPTVQAAFDADTDRAFQRLTKDRSLCLWVTWSQDDASTVAACENILRCGLSASRSGEALTLQAGPHSRTLALTGEAEDRHTVLLAINEVLAGRAELRFVWESIGADAGAFLALPCPAWAALEQRYTDVVARRLLILSPQPNLFTEVTPNMKPPSPPDRADPAKPWWKLWA